MKRENLKKIFRDTLVTGLNRSAITKCSEWSINYRVMGKPVPGPWSFKYHPWVREIHDCQSPLIIGRKGAQMAFTETAINKAFFALDILKESVLYLLPASDPDASDFSTNRFDTALEASPHLANLFSDVKNVGTKRAGNAVLYVRGSGSRKGVKSIPVARLIADEVDEMNKANLELAFERMSGQFEKQAFLLSTPTITNAGIDRYFKQSSEEHYFFRCPHCSRFIELTFPDCLIMTSDDFLDEAIKNSYLICPECKGILPHNDKPEYLQSAEWVKSHDNRISRGFTIPQLYSCTTTPGEIAIKFLKSVSDPTEEQEFFNSKLGLPHEVEGAKVTDKHLTECIGNHREQIFTPDGRSSYSQAGNRLVTMGVDVGKVLHYEITEWLLEPNARTIDINLASIAKVIKEGKTESFNDLDTLVKQYRIIYTVIDMQPETRLAREFCQRHYGNARMCHYDDSLAGKKIKEIADEFQINALRVSWMDMSLGRFKVQKIILPIDLSTEYKEHVKTPVRVYEKDKYGNPVGRYIKPEHMPDHFAHARTYSEIALILASSLMQNENINNLW